MAGWKPQKWMWPYLKHICNTGGNPVDELVNDKTSCETNMPRALLSACVQSQVTLLERLHNAGLLA